MSAQNTVGVIGLGIMGLSFARNLLEHSFKVHGFDPQKNARQSLTALGGTAHDNARSVVEASNLVLTVLPSGAALESVVRELEPVVTHGHVIAEMSTLQPEAKNAANEILARQGAILLDCPVSGTGAQAEKADVIVYMSGPAEAQTRLTPAFNAIAKEVRNVGPFGNGMKLKLVANLMVAVHNLATAEALNIANRLGLDLTMVYEALTCGGAAASKIFELRAPLMISDHYEPATMKMELFMKDLSIITQCAKDLDCPTPLLSTTIPYYQEAISQLWHDQDTAAVYQILKAKSLSQQS